MSLYSLWDIERLVCTALLVALTLMSAIQGEDGIDATSILIGQCAAFQGPAAGLGTGMNLGLKACFAEVNAGGGIGGRTLKLIEVDDGYDPDRCVDGTLKLIDEDKVFVLAGYVGTPTGKAALDLVSDKKVPLIGLFYGAMVFRLPVNHLVFNLRASYNDETEVLVEHLTKDVGATKIAVLYQNDSFGSSGLSGIEKALKKRSLTLAGKGTFERNTVAIKSGLAGIVASEPDAVVVIGPYKPVATFITEARKIGLKVPMATISFVGTANLIHELGDAAQGVIISQVVPSPADATIPLVKQYQAALHQVSPTAAPSYTSLEGYVSGRLLTLGLQKAGTMPTREKLINALESLAETDLGGMTVALSKDSHQASNLVFLTQVSDGMAVQVKVLSK